MRFISLIVTCLTLLAGFQNPPLSAARFEDFRLTEEEKGTIREILQASLEVNEPSSQSALTSTIASENEAIKRMMEVLWGYHANPAIKSTHKLANLLVVNILPMLSHLCVYFNQGLGFLTQTDNLSELDSLNLGSLNLFNYEPKSSETKEKARIFHKFVSFFLWLAVDEKVIPEDKPWGLLPKKFSHELKGTLYYQNQLYDNPHHILYYRGKNDFYTIGTLNNVGSLSSFTTTNFAAGEKPGLAPLFVFYHFQNKEHKPQLITQSGLFCILECIRQNTRVDDFFFSVQTYSGQNSDIPYKTHPYCAIKLYLDEKDFENPLLAKLRDVLKNDYLNKGLTNGRAHFFLPLTFDDLEDAAFAKLVFLQYLQIQQKIRGSSEEASGRLGKILALLNSEKPALEGATKEDSQKDFWCAPKVEALREEVSGALSSEVTTPESKIPAAAEAKESEERSLPQLIKEAEMDARRAFADRMVAEINASNQSPQSGTSPSSQKQATSTDKPKRPQSQADKRRAAAAKAKKPPESVPLTADNLFAQNPDMEEKFKELKREKFIKYKHFISLMNDTIFQGPEEELNEVLSITQSGSHVNFHIEGSAGETLAIPHGCDPSLRADHAVNLLSNLSQKLAMSLAKKKLL